MQKILQISIKTKDEKGHVRHLNENDIDIDSIKIKANELEKAQLAKSVTKKDEKKSKSTKSNDKKNKK